MNFPTKLIYETSTLLINEAARLDFVTKNGTESVFREDRIDIEIVTLNNSPFILDDWEEEERILQNRAAAFELSQLDLSVKVIISLKIFKIIF